MELFPAVMPEHTATGQTSENAATTTTTTNQLLNLSNALTIAEIEQFYRASSKPIPFSIQPTCGDGQTETIWQRLLTAKETMTMTPTLDTIRSLRSELYARYAAERNEFSRAERDAILGDVQRAYQGTRGTAYVTCFGFAIISFAHFKNRETYALKDPQMYTAKRSDAARSQRVRTSFTPIRTFATKL
jgi:hypothetical protein